MRMLNSTVKGERYYYLYTIVNS